MNEVKSDPSKEVCMKGACFLVGRILQEECTRKLPTGSLQRYYWSNFESRPKEDFHFECNRNEVLIGIQSFYREGDRIYRFECAYFQYKNKKYCFESDYTVVGESWHMHVPKDMSLVGINSHYKNVEK